MLLRMGSRCRDVLGGLGRNCHKHLQTGGTRFGLVAIISPNAKHATLPYMYAT
jgi:hypothetical protein